MFNFSGKTGSFTSSDGIPSPITTKDKNLKNQQEKISPTADKKEKKDEDDDDADFDINQFFTSDSFLQFAEEVGLSSLYHCININFIWIDIV